MVGGTIGIIVPSLQSLLTSLERVRERLKSTYFAFGLVECGSHDYIPSAGKYLYRRKEKKVGEKKEKRKKGG